MKKALILAFFGTALYFVLRNYYKNPNNTGIPNPQALVGPIYLYSILALASDFLAGLPIALAAGLTVALIWDADKAGAAKNYNQGQSTTNLFSSGSNAPNVTPGTVSNVFSSGFSIPTPKKG